MKKTRNLREKRIRSKWYVLADRRLKTPGEYDRRDLNFLSRRAAERTARALRAQGFTVFLRQRELVQTYDRLGRKDELHFHVTAYSLRHRGKERWW